MTYKWARSLLALAKMVDGAESTTSRSLRYITRANHSLLIVSCLVSLPLWIDFKM